MLEGSVSLLLTAGADRFIVCQVSAPSLVVKRGQISANCPDCQTLLLLVCLYPLKLSHNTCFCLGRLHEHWSLHLRINRVNKSTDMWIFKSHYSYVLRLNGSCMGLTVFNCSQSCLIRRQLDLQAPFTTVSGWKRKVLDVLWLSVYTRTACAVPEKGTIWKRVPEFENAPSLCRLENGKFWIRACTLRFQSNAMQDGKCLYACMWFTSS